ncbi:MAG: PHP domain-containing protein [Planctomycetaceae bacterium]|nr:PHP domain-containing protein [Planctomycetaceae bacterium]
MNTRRDFLKFSALFGTAALTQGVLNQSVFAQTNSESAAVKTYTVQMPFVLGKAEPRVITIPDVDGFKVLKGDFHIHTLFSDGSVMPVDRVKEAVLNGLDAIAITDHFEYRPNFSQKGRWQLNDKQANDYNLSYEIAKPEADKRGLVLVRAGEVTKFEMPPGHFNVLFTKDNNPINDVVDDWKKMLQTAADQGAFILWNHPGWEAPKSGGIEKGAPLVFTDKHEEAYKQGLMHGIEVFNGSQHYPIVSDWCNERNLSLFANSDIHASEFDQYGFHNLLRPINLILAKEKTHDSIKEAFFAKRIIGWAAGLLWGREPYLPALFKACVEMKSISPGTIELTNKSSLPITVRIGGFPFELPKDSPRQIYRAEGLKSLTVSNWMIGMNKPLEIPLTLE